MTWNRAGIPDQSGRIAVITGANSGLGFSSARELAARGADVIIVCRNPERGRKARELIDAAGPGDVSLVLADMSEPDEVQRAAEEITSITDRVDILINNAGLLVPGGHAVNSAGWEIHFATNYVGGFLLSRHLLPLYRDVEGARVVAVSSLAHGHFRDLRWPDPNSPDIRGYRGYAQSKLACLMFGRELDRRLAAARDTGARARSLVAHPGIAATSFIDRLPGLLGRIGGPAVTRLFNDSDSGSDALLAAATDMSITGGAYLGPTGPFEAKGAVGPAHSTRVSRDPARAKRLWEFTEELTGVDFTI